MFRSLTNKFTALGSHHYWEAHPSAREGVHKGKRRELVKEMGCSTHYRGAAHQFCQGRGGGGCALANGVHYAASLFGVKRGDHGAKWA